MTAVATGQSVQRPELTILMPCLNEARTLPACIAKAQRFLTEHAVCGEVVVADNGSTDGSQALARGLGARVVDVPERGYGAALIAGIRAAYGRFVIMGDADDSYDFSRLERFLDALRDGAELVMGNRFAGGIGKGAMPWHHRYIGNPVLSTLGRILFRAPIRDFHCGLRGFNRASVLALDLRCTGMEFASEMVVKARLANVRLVEVPTRLQKDGRDRPPHLRSFRDGWRHLKFLLLHCPRWLFLYPGLACLAVGWAAMALLTLGPVHGLGVTFDIHTLLYAGVLALLGSQIVSMAWIGNLLSWDSRLLPPPSPSLVRFRRVTLESWLLVGLGVAAAGAIVGVAALLGWWRADFARLDPAVVMRQTIPSGFLFATGIQIMFTGIIGELLRVTEAQRAVRQNTADLPGLTGIAA